MSANQNRPSSTTNDMQNSEVRGKKDDASQSGRTPDSNHAENQASLKKMSQVQRNDLLHGDKIKLILAARDPTERPFVYTIPKALITTFSPRVRQYLIAYNTQSININPGNFAPASFKFVLDWLVNTCKTIKSYKIPVDKDMEVNIERYYVANMLLLNDAIVILWPVLRNYISEHKGVIPYNMIDKIGSLGKGRTERVLKHLVDNLAYADMKGEMIPDPKFFEGWVSQRPALQKLLDESKTEIVKKYDAVQVEKVERKARREEEYQAYLKRVERRERKEQNKARAEEQQREWEASAAGHQGGGYDRVLKKGETTRLGLQA